MSRPIRRASSKWRVLVHDMVKGGSSGVAHHIQSDQIREPGPGEWRTSTTLPNTDLDEVVVGRWFHLEQMNVGHWWINIGA